MHIATCCGENDATCRTAAQRQPGLIVDCATTSGDVV